MDHEVGVVMCEYYDEEKEEEKEEEVDVDHEAGVVDESYGAEAAAGREERVRRLNTWKLADPANIVDSHNVHRQILQHI